MPIVAFGDEGGEYVVKAERQTATDGGKPPKVQFNNKIIRQRIK